ncbi:MAG: amidohydrolase family protein [SAR202 cluster bacterium]|jgi:cytosine/adenosine deaminase-related metal-dependent hydrolase|nr:amidohydrolase [Chloroflexota bacterium]MDP6420256.1 amidohydrolase family protein [SAR202 cluster bacterium]MDP6664971.1 amidohydrolase family protein [SAR202 cluster bacterium]MQG68960.1 amidohydrolase family protein [SAR202 cluster bacterium]|tara:strand:+ start:37332 stop:38867 length:1536 start_codon:yes stop_codon:yes gene_type:complete
MPSSIIRGKHVVTKITGPSTAEVIEDGAVFQRDGEIVEVGPYSELSRRHHPDEIIGSSDHVVIPGLVNAHHHVGLTPFQLGALDAPLETWIIARWAMRDVDPYLDTLYCAMQMIESGITTVMHNHMASRLPPGVELFDAASQIVDAYEESGMRVAFSLSDRDQNHLVYEDDERFLATLPSDLAADARRQINARPITLEDYLTANAELLGRKSTDRTRIFISPHNVHWCSDEMLRAISDFARRNSTGLHIHLHETIYQKMYGARHWNKTPLAHLQELGVLGPEVSCAHGVWLTEYDIDIMAETGTALCHNPSSNLRLQSGVAPLNPLLDRGVTVALGIDEAGINDDNDILQEMRVAQKIHREPGVASPAPTSHDIFHMATVNGAKVTFFDKQVGTLEPGKRADIVLIDTRRINEPYLNPNTDIVDALVYRGKGLDVDTVIVDGEVLLRNKVFQRFDKAAVIARFKESLSQPLSERELNRGALSRRILPHIQNWFETWPLEAGEPHYTYNLAE